MARIVRTCSCPKYQCQVRIVLGINRIVRIVHVRNLLLSDMQPLQGPETFYNEKSEPLSCDVHIHTQSHPHSHVGMFKSC